MWCHLPTRLRFAAATLFGLIAISLQATDVCGAQDSTGRSKLTSKERGDSTHQDSAATSPLFFAQQGGARLDATNAPELKRRVSISFTGVPLGAAVQSVAKRAGLEVTFSTELIPPAARVTMSADDVTVVTALTRVLADAPLDVLVSPDGHLTLVPRPPTLRTRIDSGGVLSGKLVDADDGGPIPYGTVLIAGTSWASFADADGHFRMARLPRGSYGIRARQIGYSPIDTAVALDSAAGTTVVLAMHRIPAVLPLVTVQGEKGCATGVPDSAVNPGLALVFAQVRENVDRVRLLLEMYPFRYSREEQMVLELTPGGDLTQWIDTVAYESGSDRPYRVGGIVQVDADTGKRAHHYMYLPTFSAFGNLAFLAAHCFVYGGTESFGSKGAKVIRIDFHPSPTIRVPDVEGSIYLDAQRFVVRRAVFRLTKPEAARPRVLGVTVSTTFREFVPFVPIFDAVESTTPLPPGHPPAGQSTVVRGAGPLTFNSRASTVDRTLIERYHVVAVTFTHRVPGEQLDVSAGVTSRRAPIDTRSVELRAPRVGDTARSPARLAGRVIQPDGSSVAGASVELSGTRDTAVTDGTGHFTIQAAQTGPFVVNVRRLGFQPSRTAVTLSPDNERDVTVTLVRTVTVLPTVTTTAAERAAYRDVGFDQRMREGVGQFLTDAQIQRRQATTLSQLLEGMRGINVRNAPKNFNATIEGTRGMGSCVGYVIDGVPQTQLASQTVTGKQLAPDDADNLVEPSMIGAIEVYTPSERPTQFGPGLQEHPLPLDTLGSRASDRPPAPQSDQQCSLVVIWTRVRLGLSAAPTLVDTAHTGDVIHGQPVWADATCLPGTATDTADFVIYATLEAERPKAIGKGVWSAYTDKVLETIERWSALPTELLLPAFGPPFEIDERDNSAIAGKHARRVAPTLSSALMFTLDSAGRLTSARVVASSLSGSADTSVLAMLLRASGSHAFPRIPRPYASVPTVQFELFVSSVEPPRDTRAAILGDLEVPSWPLAHPAALIFPPSPEFGTDGANVVTVSMAVDHDGRAIAGTEWALRSATQPDTAEDAGSGTRVAQTLRQLRFDPARIGACPVAQLVTQSVAVPTHDTSSR